MVRLIIFLSMLAIPCLKSVGQCTIFKDRNGQVLTTCEFYAAGNRNTAVVHSQETYLGSPYLTYPIWQDGAVQLDSHGKELNCQLAYDLVNNEVKCRFAGDSAVKLVTPEAFTINGIEFVRQRNELLGIDYRMYSTVLHDGPTKLLLSLSNNLETLYDSKYNKEYNIRGIYRTIKKYYIRKENAEPKLINLSKKSLLDVLNDQSAVLDAKIPNRQLTTTDVIGILNYYDSLVADARKNLAHFSKEDVFKQILQHKINYPAWVGNQGIYGRVYAGFDVDSLGLIRNVVILSPDNVGFGFTVEVKRAMETLPNVDPNFRGRYALPIAFTFTNSKGNSGPNIPANRLPDDRYQNRTMLEEVTIPFIVSKSSVVPKEVWGYYK